MTIKRGGFFIPPTLPHLYKPNAKSNHMYKGIEIQFANLKTLEGRDGLIIQADIKYNGKKIATYRDDGHGGCVDIDAIGSIDKDKDGNHQKSKALIENRALLIELQEEFAKLPKVKSSHASILSEFEDCIEYAMDDFINERELLNDAKKGILTQEAEGSSGYSIIKFKAGSITSMLKKYTKPQVIQLLEKNIKQEIEDDKHILAQDYYISIGVNPEIFTKA